jgi:uncharacterized protein (DUF2235 family)
LAHVLELCGIPTKERGAESISLDPQRLRKVATSAVSILYRFGLTVPNSEKRQARVDLFNQEHACLVGPDSGATPYFIGAWDSVAAIGSARFLPHRYDLHEPRGVRFVRHALAIDEYRRDFARVPWGGTALPPHREGEPWPFEQIWFAGNHADIGGSYPENESRLSDITLDWMTDFITKKLPVDGRVVVSEDLLRLFPSHEGMMHDECMVGVGGTPARWFPQARDVPNDAVLHPTVYDRLKMDRVRNYTSYGKYRPAPLRNHSKAKDYFEDT